MLKSGNLDIDYLGRILEFALITLQKLSSPANDDEMKAANQRLLKELAETCEAREKPNHSPALAMIKGLRFVLEQIQVFFHVLFFFFFLLIEWILHVSFVLKALSWER